MYYKTQIHVRIICSYLRKVLNSALTGTKSSLLLFERERIEYTKLQKVSSARCSTESHHVQKTQCLGQRVICKLRRQSGVDATKRPKLLLSHLELPHHSLGTVRQIHHGNNPCNKDGSPGSRVSFMHGNSKVVFVPFRKNCHP